LLILRLDVLPPFNPFVVGVHQLLVELCASLFSFFECCLELNNFVIVGLLFDLKFDHSFSVGFNFFPLVSQQII